MSMIGMKWFGKSVTDITDNDAIISIKLTL